MGNRYYDHYDPEIGDLICAEIANCKSLRTMCDETLMQVTLPNGEQLTESFRDLAVLSRRREELEGQGARIVRVVDFPCRRTVYAWRRKYPEFDKQYLEAKDDQADAFAEDIIEISDDGTNDWMQSNDPDNLGYHFNGEHVQRSKLRVEARKWTAAKLKPRSYGDRVAAELTGANGGPIQTADVTENELARRIAFALANGMKTSEKSP